ncbi:DMT family transporter [Metaclostridioides mangenotii]|uniref:Transporter family-2 protein n=1 Tax=Metaclostridioides mangenotii TaxID=1540 RepID=A0ABS4E8Y0_9FIRM|nr:DMT family transporter [Clostridioides mangenotii]MBP1854401.1 transporter family-2 protein [Clostridioides mangenotii]
MYKFASIIFALLAGGSTALEAFINGELGKNTTALVATFFSLLVGAVFFLISIVLAGDVKELVFIRDVNPKFLLGGIFGGLIIYFTIMAIPSLGVSNTLVIILVSQILLGFFIDSILLGEVTMHIYKYIGIALMAIGAFFILN